MAREGEGEAQRQRHAFHAHVLKEVRDALDDVVKELQEEQALREGPGPEGDAPKHSTQENCKLRHHLRSHSARALNP